MGHSRSSSGTLAIFGGGATRRDAAQSEAQVLERLWGVRACGHCGETIVLGERVFRVETEGRHEALCSACAAASWDRSSASLHVLPRRSQPTVADTEDAA